MNALFTLFVCDDTRANFTFQQYISILRREYCKI